VLYQLDSITETEHHAESCLGDYHNMYENQNQKLDNNVTAVIITTGKYKNFTRFLKRKNTVDVTY